MKTQDVSSDHDDWKKRPSVLQAFSDIKKTTLLWGDVKLSQRDSIVCLAVFMPCRTEKEEYRPVGIQGWILCRQEILYREALLTGPAEEEMKRGCLSIPETEMERPGKISGRTGKPEMERIAFLSETAYAFFYGMEPGTESMKRTEPAPSEYGRRERTEKHKM